jgi:hypothetical protein
VNERSRPKAASQSLSADQDLKPTLGHAGDNTTSDAPGEPVAAQIRRRRAAANRLPSLPDGRQDPWDPESGRRLVVSITTDTSAGIALLKGSGARHLADWLQLDPRRSRSGGGWVVDADRVPDLVALAEWLRYVVTERERAA